MSRMTKFLNQKCVIEPYKLDDQGLALTNEFGEIQYAEGISCKCRHEVVSKDVQVANGSIVKSMSRYFLDEANEIKADYLIDGRAVLTVISYVNAAGAIEGYEVYV